GAGKSVDRSLATAVDVRTLDDFTRVRLQQGSGIGGIADLSQEELGLVIAYGSTVGSRVIHVAAVLRLAPRTAEICEPAVVVLPVEVPRAAVGWDEALVRLGHDVG